MLPHVLCFVLALLAVVRAQQTLTIPDPDDPLTSIVEVITLVTDVVNGIVSTETLRTLPYTSTTTTTTPIIPTTSTSSTTSTTTTPPQQVVGQPGATPAAGPIPYQYTTTNAAGATIVVQDTFTPTFPVITPVAPSSTGTVLEYSQWLSTIGTNTVAAENISGATRTWQLPAAFWGAMISGLIGLWSGLCILL